MKKIITTLTILLISLTAYSANDSTKLSERIYDDAKSALSQLGSALKVGSEHVYRILVVQQAVNSVIFLTLAIIGIILIIPVIAIKKDNFWYDSFLGIVSIISCILGGMVIVISIINVDVIITGFINPEYGAVKEILNVMTK